MSEHVRYHVRNGLGRITLSHPARRNALSHEMLVAIREALESVSASGDVAALWIGAEGPAFCAGMDLKAADLGDPDQARRYASAFAGTYRALLTLPVPLLCAVDGPTTGGGVGLPAAADLVWVGPDARFALPETRVGLVPALVSVVLARRLSPKVLTGMALGAVTFDAVSARAAGLADFEAEDATAASLEFADGFLRDHSPEATRRTKELLLRELGPELDQRLEAAEEEFRASVATASAARGLRAFREKRAVDWRTEEGSHG